MHGDDCGMLYTDVVVLVLVTPVLVNITECNTVSDTIPPKSQGERYFCWTTALRS